MKKMLMACAAVAIAAQAGAYDFEEGGFYYNKLSDNTVELTYKNTQNYGLCYNQTTVTVPETVTHENKTYTVTRIGNNAFRSTYTTSLQMLEGDDLEYVNLPESITEIGDYAFYNRYILGDNFKFPSGLVKLGKYAFYFNQWLQVIDLPAGVKEIPEGCFQKVVYLNKINLRDGLESIGDNAFADSGLLYIYVNGSMPGYTTLPSTVTRIGNGVFNNCISLHDLVLNDNVIYDGDEPWCAFDGCKNMVSVTLGDGIKSIGQNCFRGTGISELTIPAGCESFSTASLTGMKNLTKLTIAPSDEVLTINQGSLNNVVNNDRKYLETLEIGRPVSYEDVFKFETELTSVTVLGDKLFESPVFAQEVYENATITVPEGLEQQFKADPKWGKFWTKGGDVPAVDPAVKCGIDVEKIRYTVGEGENLYAVVIDFNNDTRLDNLVLGYRTDEATVNPIQVISAIAAADKRMEIGRAQLGFASVKFDLDGNNQLDEKDAVRINSAEGAWRFSSDLKASDGTTPVISLYFATTGMTEPDTEAPYYFYLPGPDEKGVWVPEAMTVKLSDDSFVLPVLVQPQEDEVKMTTNWQASSSNTTYRLDTKIIKTPYTFVDGSYHARPTLVGATGTTYVRYRPQFGSTYTESNFMTLTVEAPEIPMTGMSFAETEIVSPLNKVVEYSIIPVPENATYTAVSLAPEDNTIATWSATAGLKTTKKEGETTVKATYIANGNVTAEFTLKAVLMNPVTSVNFGPGTEDGVINVPVRQLIGLKPVVEPADADIPDVTIVLSDNGTSRDDMTCSTYNVNWWDIDNVRSQFLELSGHRPTGDHPAKLTVTSADGKYEKEFTVNVIEADRTPLEGGYTEGTIILNEEWFGHTNGGLNYFTEDGEVIYQAYEKENPGMAFGATSQHGVIWNDKLIVASKQAADGGDPMPGGGRLVIAEASTLKRLGSLDNLSITNASGTTLSGDGRAVCGATPDKIYVSTNNGVFVVDITNPAEPAITGRIGMGEGDDNQDLYNGQVGDMVNACGHVFAVMQGGGLMIIDIDTDTLNPATISDANIQGVTQTEDGNVWYCTVGKDDTGISCSVFVAIDPETLEEVDRVMMPASIGTVACSWGAWRSTAFKGSHTGNDIWFVTGAAGIMGGATGDYYRYTVGDDPSQIKPFFTLSDKTGINGFGEEVGLMTYGTPLYDPRSNQLIVMAGKKGAASGGYRDHWTMWVNAETGEIDRTIKLNPYYWFQSLPILPDKHDVEINLDDITCKADDEPLVFNLAALVDDKDNINRNIRLSLESAPMSVKGREAEETNANPADITLEGNILTIQPLTHGQTSFTVRAESNGRQVSKNVNLTVNVGTGIDGVYDNSRVWYADGRLHIEGLEGETFSISDINGFVLTRFTVDSDNYILDMNGHSGVYVVSRENGAALKISVR